MNNETIPHDLKLEQAVLCCLLIDENAISVCLEEGLTPECFYRSSHRIIYDTVIELTTQDKPFDELIIRDELERNGLLDAAGGDLALMDLSSAVTTSSKLREYLPRLKEYHTRRELIRLGHQTVERATTEGNSADELINQTAETTKELALFHKPPDKTPHVSSVVEQIMETVDAQIENRWDSSAIKTGIRELDNVYQNGGLCNGTVNCIAGFPGAGKSQLALNMALRAARDENIPVLIFSFEMPREQLVWRMSSTLSGVNRAKIRDRVSTPVENMKFKEAIKEVGNLPIYTEHSVTGIHDLCARTKAYRDDKGIGLLVIDYCQIVPMPGDNMAHEIGDITRSVKQLAISLDIPVLLLSQFNREAPCSKSGPRMKDMKGSSSIEQDVDTILCLWVVDNDYDAARKQDENGRFYIDTCWKMPKNREGDPSQRGSLKFYNSIGRFK